jgi:hypothetical protein
VILGKLQAWALTILAVLAVLVGAYVKGGRAAKAAADKQRELDDARRAAAGAKGVHDAAIETNRLRDGDAADQLRRDWMRDDDKK